MGKFRDLSGQKFGKLTAIEPVRTDKYGQKQWRCLCDCGRENIVTGANLTSGGTKSCGCSTTALNLKDKKFGKLLVLKEAGRARGGQVKWLCQCDCGKTTVTVGAKLTYGSTKSCGCIIAAKSLVGQRFNKLTVLARQGSNGSGSANWICKCDCGQETIASGKDLRHNHKKSCGCLQKEVVAALATIHGAVTKGIRSPEYSAWVSLRSRCNDCTNPVWKHYGGRGIDYDPRWNDFVKFLNDVAHRPSHLHSLDRIDNDRGYWPNNVRWATKREQMNNTRRNVFLTFNGKSKSIKQWALDLNISYPMIRHRIERGWPAHFALTASHGTLLSDLLKQPNSLEMQYPL